MCGWQGRSPREVRPGVESVRAGRLLPVRGPRVWENPHDSTGLGSICTRRVRGTRAVADRWLRVIAGDEAPARYCWCKSQAYAGPALLHVFFCHVTGVPSEQHAWAASGGELSHGDGVRG